jgi:hypothetical protein
LLAGSVIPNIDVVVRSAAATGEHVH